MRFSSKRYREEAHVPNAVWIKWELLDRRDIPAKYDGIAINHDTIKIEEYS